jgi:dTDP-4-amino-4,6-dideoxygalactose transaminase
VPGAGQRPIRVLEERVERKRQIFEHYKDALGDLPCIEFMPEASYGKSNRWLTVILITPDEFGADREQVRLALEAENSEARPLWKPMHLQPVFEVEASKAGKVKGKYKARVVGEKWLKIYSTADSAFLPARP